MAEQPKTTTTDRRTVLRTTALGVAVAGVGVTAAACSSSNSVAQGAGAPTAQAAEPSGPVNLTTTADVPVKSGFINTQYAVVVTQPTAGEYKAFTAVCTHQQCLVGSVTNNVILCPCHGSEYDASTGAVIQGPAPQPLAAKTIKVSGNEIILEA